MGQIGSRIDKKEVGWAAGGWGGGAGARVVTFGNWVFGWRGLGIECVFLYRGITVLVCFVLKSSGVFMAFVSSFLPIFLPCKYDMFFHACSADSDVSFSMLLAPPLTVKIRFIWAWYGARNLINLLFRCFWGASEVFLHGILCFLRVSCFDGFCSKQQRFHF
jgi:hypothetical protein